MEAVAPSETLVRELAVGRQDQMTAEIPISVRELDYRANGGVQIRLLWCQQDGRLWVAVMDTRTGRSFCLDVREGERPLDVFHHPYAYAAYRRTASRLRSGDVEQLVFPAPSKAHSRNPNR